MVTTTLTGLRERFAAGGPVGLTDVLDAAGLGGRERHVLGERMAGRSHEEIAADGPMRKPDGGCLSRQRVEQIEAGAVAKLGLGGSLAASVHEAERLDRGLEMVARGRLVRLVELHADPAEVAARGRQKVDEREAEHERLVAEFLIGIFGGYSVSPDTTIEQHRSRLTTPRSGYFARNRGSKASGHTFAPSSLQSRKSNRDTSDAGMAKFRF